ncbi:glycosyltransferase family 2 protein, partial [bacterium]|nr:glycosyltransferase family 2 protein [bacterium]
VVLPLGRKHPVWGVTVGEDPRYVYSGSDEYGWIDRSRLASLFLRIPPIQAGRFELIDLRFIDEAAGKTLGGSPLTALNLLLSFAVYGLSIVALAREKRWMAGFEARLQERWAVLPAISVVIPAFNEEDSILQSVKSAMKSRYRSLEIVVVNDGSTDNTMALLHAAYALQPMKNPGGGGGLGTEPIRGLWVAADGALLGIDKHNGGKADAINAGINMARSPLICVVDADTLLERDTLLYLAEPFFDNPHMLVAGGFIRLKAPEQGFVARSLYWLQQLEYARSYGCFRAGLNVIHANVIISGALGLFRRAAAPTPFHRSVLPAAERRRATTWICSDDSVYAGSAVSFPRYAPTST